MRVTASAASADEAVQCYQQHRPDVTIMDLQLGGTSGVTAIRTIRTLDPAARIVVLTMMRGDEDSYRAMEAGAATYLLKDTAIEDLTQIVRDVHAGRSPRELVRRGLRNREIGISLGISEEMVRSHVRSIPSKLDVPDRTAAVDVALRRGILHLQ